MNAARTLLGLAVVRADPIAPDRVVPEIKQLHAARKSLASSHVPARLRTAAEERFGSWRAAIEAAGFDYEQLGLKVKRYSDKDLLDWLRALAKAHPHMTLNELSTERRFNATVTRFGDLRGALKRARIEDWPVRQKQRWTKQTILVAMRALAAEGKPMSSSTAVSQAAKNHFGSLETAAKEAGVPFRQHARALPPEELIARLRDLEREHGIVTNALAEAAGVRSPAITLFGSLTAACEAAGVIGFERMLDERHAREEDPTALLDELRSIAARVKRPLKRRDLSWTLHQALLRHFDSLEAARERAGLPQPEVARRWSRQRVLAELRREHRKGTRMTADALIEAGRQDLVSAIPVYVGPFASARRAAGIPRPVPLQSSHVPFLKVWDEDRVLEEIDARVKAGESLAPSLVPRPLESAARRYWGSYRNAVEVAGHDYSRHVLRQDRTDEELVDLVRSLAEARPEMTLEELRGLPVMSTLYKHFGSAEAAAERAGVADWPQREATPVMSRKELREYLRERQQAGAPVGSRDVDRHVRFSMSRVHPRWSVALARLGIR